MVVFVLQSWTKHVTDSKQLVPRHVIS